MQANMYAVAGDCPSNEELASKIQEGNRQAEGLLISQNEGYLTKLARNYVRWCGLEDLKQEGAIALLEAAKQFDPSYGTKLLTYATPAIESAMMDHAAQASLSLRIPSSRYNQLRKVANIYAGAEDKSAAALIQVICEKLEVSSKVAVGLLKEYQVLSHPRQLGDDVLFISCGGNPARAYDRHMRHRLLLQLMEDILKPRELNLVRYHLGIGQSDGEGMTFQELAIRLNYNGPSGAEKTYNGALGKLKKALYSSPYGQWLSIQKIIRRAKLKAKADDGSYITPQGKWLDDKGAGRVVHL